jgi:hypothetical protein
LIATSSKRLPSPPPVTRTKSKDSLREALAAIAQNEKVQLLLGDSHVAAELKSKIHSKEPVPPEPRRTVGALRLRSQEIRDARERANAERREEELCRQTKEAEKARHARLKTLKQSGAGILARDRRRNRVPQCVGL